MVTIQPRQIEVAVVHHSYRSMIVTFIKHDGHIDLDYAISISQIEQEARRQPRPEMVKKTKESEVGSEQLEELKRKVKEERASRGKKEETK